MIKVDRSTVAIPKILNSDAIQQAFADAEGYFASRQSVKQRRFSFKSDLFSHPEVTQALSELFHGKCAYCETYILADQPANVGHFRPMSRSHNLDGTVAPDHYWWLAYDWSNLYLSCVRCDRMKAHRFPVAADRAEPGSTGEALLAEQALLLDPCYDDPREHLVFTEDGEIISDTERGRLTIEILGLNRSSLLSQRRDVFGETRRYIELLEQAVASIDESSAQIVDDSLTYLNERTQASSPFAAMQRQLIYRWLRESNLGEKVDSQSLLDSSPDLVILGRELIATVIKQSRFVSSADTVAAQKSFVSYKNEQVIYNVEAEDAVDKHAYYTGAKRIERIEIHNFKVIEDLTLEFPPAQAEHESWLMLLGENAVGKSSVLQAVALTLMGQKHCNDLGLDASSFVRRAAGVKEGYVRVHLTNVTAPIELRFRDDSAHFEVRPEDPKILLLGYGATRLLPKFGRDSDQERKHIRIKNLFDPTAPLNDAEAWLTNEQQVDDDMFDEVAQALKDLLLLGEADEFVRENGKVEAIIHEGRQSLSELSDGYQSVVALCTDIMISLSEKWQSMQDAEGVVLLDEIEVHLHPSWKMEIVERLRQVFPRVAFLVTTHDPLCLRGLAKGEIVVLRYDSELDKIIAVTDVPAVDHLRADQILTSFLFDLPTTRGDSTARMIARYSELLSKTQLSPVEQQEFDELKGALDEALKSGETPAQRQVETAVQKALTEMIKVGPTPEASVTEMMDPELALEIKRQLAELLSK